MYLWLVVDVAYEMDNYRRQVGLVLMVEGKCSRFRYMGSNKLKDPF